jgi:REP element-mobilizing transposase RayT
VGVSPLVNAVTLGITRNHPADAGRSPCILDFKLFNGIIPMDRHWFLTWTTYGSRLPGDNRSFVSPIREENGAQVKHNKLGEPYDSAMPRLEEYARSLLKGDPIRLNESKAVDLFAQFQETATHRGWELLAIAIMADHVHVVLGVLGDPKPEDLLRDLKSYGSRKLNKSRGVPKSETWWTESGSTRKLATREGIFAAIQYVLDQEYPLLVWTAPIPEMNLSGGRIV